MSLADPLDHLAAYFIGLLITIFSGPIIEPILKNKDWIDQPPKSVPPKSKGGAIIGTLERVVFFCALAAGFPTFIPAWLVFKAASKWDLWQNIIKIESEKDKHIKLEARKLWGSYVYMRFLIGTLLNILLAGLGIFMAQVMIRY
jgi:hypothetical protein